MIKYIFDYRVAVFIVLSVCSVTCFGYEVAITGVVRASDGNLASAYVQVIKPGFPFRGVSAGDVSWHLLAKTNSQETDGTYTVTVDAEGPVLVAVHYAPFKYAMTRQINVDSAGTITGIDFTLPELDFDSVSVKLNILEGSSGNEVEIDYYSRQFIMLLVSSPPASVGRLVQIHGRDLLTSQKRLFGLPPGDYTIIVGLDLSSVSTEFKYISQEVTLPIIDPENKPVELMFTN